MRAASTADSNSSRRIARVLECDTSNVTCALPHAHTHTPHTHTHTRARDHLHTRASLEAHTYTEAFRPRWVQGSRTFWCILSNMFRSEFNKQRLPIVDYGANHVIGSCDLELVPLKIFQQNMEKLTEWQQRMENAKEKKNTDACNAKHWERIAFLLFIRSSRTSSSSSPSSHYRIPPALVPTLHFCWCAHSISTRIVESIHFTEKKKILCLFWRRPVHSFMTWNGISEYIYCESRRVCPFVVLIASHVHVPVSQIHIFTH